MTELTPQMIAAGWRHTPDGIPNCYVTDYFSEKEGLQSLLPAKFPPMSLDEMIPLLKKVTDDEEKKRQEL